MPSPHDLHPTHDWTSHPGGDLLISPAEVHVWRLPLDSPGAVLEPLATTLRPEERARAEKFFFDRDRNAYIAARGVLRQLLSRYLGCPPSELQFGYESRGKPFLASPSSKRPLNFNVAHSRDIALLAFSAGPPVGVDVEFIRSDISSEEIAVRYFAPQEVAELLALAPEQRPEAFFLGWTRKEAYVKALGDGLQIPLASFCVSLTPGQPATLESADSSRWTLRNLSPGPGYAGALVAEGKNWTLRCFAWQPPQPGL
jgi:4'-phosphopantetheinyl transferase